MPSENDLDQIHSPIDIAAKILQDQDDWLQSNLLGPSTRQYNKQVGEVQADDFSAQVQAEMDRQQSLL